MANIVSTINYNNTFGDWVISTNALVVENNNLAANAYIKQTGTLYLNDPTLGLQVANNASIGRLTLGAPLPVTSGGTGATTSVQVLTNLLPSNLTTPAGYVLATGGPGTYYWAAGGSGGGGSAAPGTTINSTRIYPTVNTGQTVFSTPTYVPGASQLRVYVNGVRQFNADYTETSNTVVTLSSGTASGDIVLLEVDGYTNYVYYANNIAFTAPFGDIISTANTIQLALQDLETRKATITSPTLVTPILGVATATSVNKVTITPPAIGSTITIANNKTLTVSNTITLAGVDGKSLSIANTITLTGEDNISYDLSTLTRFPQNNQSNNYTMVLSDAGKVIVETGANTILTIPSNGSVPYPVGTSLTFVNNTSNNISITITTDTMYWSGTASTGTRVLSQRGIATAYKVSSNVWFIAGGGLT